MKKQRKFDLRKLTFCAIMIALATVLSLIPIWKMPLGGSVTLLSMLPICMISIRFGIGWGIASSFLFSLIQMFLGFAEVMSWGLTPTVLVSCFLLDYILAYTSLGFAGIFRKSRKIGLEAGKSSLTLKFFKWNKTFEYDLYVRGICLGIVLSMILRFIFHLISGVVLFDAWTPEGWHPFIYSVCYNGAYMLPEMIFTSIAAVFISRMKQMKKLLRN